ncbi:MAG: hypothetical protein AAFN92_12460, partial [Bacteroidota bacterium]
RFINEEIPIFLPNFVLLIPTRSMRCLLLALLFPCSLSAQEVIRVEEQPPSLSFLLNIALGIDTEYDVENYKVVYTTTDAFGQPDTASGLLCVPNDPDIAFPLAIYNHGTVFERDGVPSVEGVPERLLPQAIGAYGYITVAPDYLGLGESDGFHPYVHAATEASAGRDMLLAVRDWLDARGTGRNDQLFVTGYSQGGHASSALHMDLALNPGDDELTVTAAAHLSGPYSISEVMLSTVFREGRPTLPGYIVYTYVSYNNVYGIYDSLGQIFREPYLGVIDSFENGLLAAGAFNASLDRLLDENEALLVDMFQDSIRQVLADRDPSQPIIQALIDNDTYDWAPTAPTLLYYCTEDEQVPFRNALLADSVMRANGSTSVTVESGGPLDHGACVLPAAMRTIAFFRDFAQRFPVSLGEPADRPDVGLAPNPVAAGSVLRVNGLKNRAHDYVLYDLSGRQLLRGQTGFDGSLRLPADLPTGVSVLRVSLADGTSVVRRLRIQ